MLPSARRRLGAGAAVADAFYQAAIWAATKLRG